MTTLKFNDPVGKSNQKRVDSIRKFVEAHGATYHGQESSMTDYGEHVYIHFTYSGVEMEARVNNDKNFYVIGDIVENGLARDRFEEDGITGIRELKAALVQAFDWFDEKTKQSGDTYFINEFTGYIYTRDDRDQAIEMIGEPMAQAVKPIDPTLVKLALCEWNGLELEERRTQYSNDFCFLLKDYTDAKGVCNHGKGITS